jgi:hypothetical protein
LSLPIARIHKEEISKTGSEVIATKTIILFCAAMAQLERASYFVTVGVLRNVICFESPFLAPKLIRRAL